MPTESSPAVLAVPAVHIVSPDEAHMVTGHGVGSLVPLMVSLKIAARFVDRSCWFIVVSFQRPCGACGPCSGWVACDSSVR